MAITYNSQGAGASTETSGAALSPLCPATVVAGDILIGHVFWEGTATTPSTPAGWTLLSGPHVIESTIAQHWVFGKIADGTEDGAAVAFGAPAVTTQRAARIYSLSGRVSGTITDLVRGFAHLSHATDPQMPTVATTQAGSLAVALVAQNDNNVVASATGESGGDWTEAVAAYTVALTPGFTIEIQTAAMAAIGTISGGAIATTNDPCGVVAFEVRDQVPLVYSNFFFSGRNASGSRMTMTPTIGLAAGWPRKRKNPRSPSVPQARSTGGAFGGGASSGPIFLRRDGSRKPSPPSSIRPNKSGRFRLTATALATIGRVGSRRLRGLTHFRFRKTGGSPLSVRRLDKRGLRLQPIWTGWVDWLNRLHKSLRGTGPAATGPPMSPAKTGSAGIWPLSSKKSSKPGTFPRRARRIGRIGRAIQSRNRGWMSSPSRSPGPFRLIRSILGSIGRLIRSVKAGWASPRRCHSIRRDSPGRPTPTPIQAARTIPAIRSRRHSRSRTRGRFRLSVNLLMSIGRLIRLNKGGWVNRPRRPLIRPDNPGSRSQSGHPRGRPAHGRLATGIKILRGSRRWLPNWAMIPRAAARSGSALVKACPSATSRVPISRSGDGLPAPLSPRSTRQLKTGLFRLNDIRDAAIARVIRCNLAGWENHPPRRSLIRRSSPGRRTPIPTRAPASGPPRRPWRAGWAASSPRTPGRFRVTASRDWKSAPVMRRWARWAGPMVLHPLRRNHPLKPLAARSVGPSRNASARAWLNSSSRARISRALAGWGPNNRPSSIPRSMTGPSRIPGWADASTTGAPTPVRTGRNSSRPRKPGRSRAPISIRSGRIGGQSRRLNWDGSPSSIPLSVVGRWTVPAWGWAPRPRFRRPLGPTGSSGRMSLTRPPTPGSLSPTLCLMPRGGRTGRRTNRSLRPGPISGRSFPRHTPMCGGPSLHSSSPPICSLPSFRRLTRACSRARACSGARNGTNGPRTIRWAGMQWAGGRTRRPQPSPAVCGVLCGAPEGDKHIYTVSM